MSTLRFTDDDRDDRGFVTAPTPPPAARSLADLLPTAPARARPTLSRQDMITSAIIVPLLLGALLYLSSGRSAAPLAREVTPAAITAAPTAVPTRAPHVPLIAAYAAPDGARLGQIEATRAITPTAHYGADWIQADVAGSGRIWLRAADWPALAILGPDLAPRPTIAPAPVLAVEPPPAPPAPTQCAQAGIAGKMVEVCGTDDLGTLEAAAKAAWLAQYGGTPGALDSPTPQPWQRQDALQNRLANDHAPADRNALLTHEEPRP